jgi:hypothetical protein
LILDERLQNWMWVVDAGVTARLLCIWPRPPVEEQPGVHASFVRGGNKTDMQMNRRKGLFWATRPCSVVDRVSHSHLGSVKTCLCGFARRSRGETSRTQNHVVCRRHRSREGAGSRLFLTIPNFGSIIKGLVETRSSRSSVAKMEDGLGVSARCTHGSRKACVEHAVCCFE